MTTVPTIRPEVELLLCCARTHMNAAMAERIRALLRNNLDWEYLLRAAEQHQVTPLLYWHLNTTGSEAIPKVAMNQLRGHFRMNAQRNLLLTRELLRILHLFETQGVPAIPLKGPVLAAAIYGNLALRHFGDLDILVHRRDILSAKALLTSGGYRLTSQLGGADGDAIPQEYDFDPREAAYLDPKYYILIRDDHKVRVDLQWRITRRSFSFSLDTGRLWVRVEPLSFAGATVLTFPPEDLLLILCVHGCKHHWRQLKWICDIAELVRVQGEVDWEQALEQAGTQGGKRMCALGLFLAHDLLGTTLSAKILQKIQADSVVRSVAAQFRKELCSDAGGSYEAFESFAFHLRLRERLRDRVWYRLYYLCQYLYIAITPNAKDQALLPLPAFLALFYYLLRPIRLLKERRPNLWRRPR